MRVLSLIWTAPSWHPVVAFTAQMLSENGHVVHLLAREPDPDSAIPGTGWFGDSTTVRCIAARQHGWANRLAYGQFVVTAGSLARKLRPDLVMGYDMHGVFAAHWARTVFPSARLLYHNLDLADPRNLGFYDRLIKRGEQRAASRADLVLFSAAGRAAFFQQGTRLRRPPLVVLNCQRRTDSWTNRGELETILAGRGLHFDRLVVRLGSMGPGHAIETTIQSMLSWQGNWGLVLAGVPLPSYLSHIEQFVASLGLTDRVVLLPSVPYSLWFDCLYSAHLGVALYEPGGINHAYMAGAGNRLNLYLKAGIPSIVPNFADFQAFAQKYGAARIVEPGDPASVSAAVNTILGDEQAYVSLCRGARRAFEEEYNYEVQFQPVLDWFMASTQPRLANAEQRGASR